MKQTHPWRLGMYSMSLSESPQILHLTMEFSRSALNLSCSLITSMIFSSIFSFSEGDAVLLNSSSFSLFSLRIFRWWYISDSIIERKLFLTSLNWGSSMEMRLHLFILIDPSLFCSHSLYIYQLLYLNLYQLYRLAAQERNISLAKNRIHRITL